MPTYLRNFYLKKLIDTKKEEKKQAKKSQSANRPAINPRFKT